MAEIIAGILLVIGAGFCFIAAIGLVRFPDVYTRMHAASKAGAFAVGLMMLAIALVFAETSVVTRALVGLVFFLLTSPVSAHLLARAAYLAGIEPWEGTHIDALKIGKENQNEVNE